MKTTLSLNESVAAELKREAARQRRSMSEIVEVALRLFFKSTRRKPTPTPLPSFDMGNELVDISDRDALYDAMEGR